MVNAMRRNTRLCTVSLDVHVSAGIPLSDARLKKRLVTWLTTPSSKYMDNTFGVNCSPYSQVKLFNFHRNLNLEVTLLCGSKRKL